MCARACVCVCKTVNSSVSTPSLVSKNRDVSSFVIGSLFWKKNVHYRKKKTPDMFGRELQ